MKKCTLNLPAMMLLILGLLCCTGKLQAQSLVWAKICLGQGASASRGAVTDAQGNVYITGYFTGVTDFDPGPGIQTMTSSGWDTYILKLNAAGDFVWAKQFNSVETNTAPVMSEPADMVIDSLGNLYIAGNFMSSDNAPGSIDLDPGPGVFTLTSSGSMYTADVFVVKLTPAGDLVWARQLAGPDSESCSSLALDGEGHVLITGNFFGTADFNPGTGVHNLTATTSVGGDVFVAKLDNNGDYVWALNLPCTETIRAVSVKAGPDNKAYVMGAFHGTVDFDPGTGTQLHTTDPGPVSWRLTNVFVLELDASGNFSWVKRMGDPVNINSEPIVPQAMAVDGNGQIYITGGFSDTVDFDPGAGVAHLVSLDGTLSRSDVFISKLNSNGDLAWAKRYGGINDDFPYAMQIDAFSNIYTSGKFRNQADMDPSDTSEYLVIPAAVQGGFYISKLDSAGNFEWASVLTSEYASLAINGQALALSPVDNSIVAASEFSGPLDFDPGAGVLDLTSTENTAFALKLKNCNPIHTTLTATACDSFVFDGTAYTQSGNYQHVLSAASECDSTILLDLVITPRPVATIIRNGTTLSATASNATYQWIGCDQDNAPIPGATNQSYTVATNGSYAVVVTRNNCSDTSDCFLVSNVGINGKQLSLGVVQVYPNPVEGIVTIKMQKALKDGTVRLSNILGQVVIEKRRQQGKLFTCDMTGLPAGTYIIEMQQEGAVFREKITKE